jgi:hypothetical protein
MQSAATEPVAPEPSQFEERGRLLWIGLGLLAAAQLVAMWLLCSHQVRLAEARRAETAVQAMALSDCLEYIPGSTIASCTGQLAASRAAPADPTGGQAVAPVTGAALPVSFSYR